MAVEDGWRRDCFARERRDFGLVLAIAAVLFPGYLIYDTFLEPALLPTSIGCRLIGTPALVIALVMTRRAATLAAARAWFVAAIGLCGALVAFMLPRGDHFSAAVLAYSAFYWGCAALSWPVRWSIALFTWQLLAVATVFVVAPGELAGADMLSAGFLLVTAATLTTAAIHVRRVAHQAAFRSGHALAERNRELEIAMARLGDTQARLVAQEKLSALGRMLAGLSHEINNPINVITNNLGPVREHVHAVVEVLALARGGAAVDAIERASAERELAWRIPDLDDALNGMDAATEHMIQVHADLRAFIRGDAPTMTRADVGAGLRATAALVSRRAPGDVQVEVELGALPPVVCQPGQLNQVWLNLVQNALDAVGARGTIHVRARARDQVIEVSVADSGPGIAPGFRARLFEPFATTKDPGKGTGLGLAISYQIIQRHGGRLYLDDRQSTGARFVVELPAA